MTRLAVYRSNVRVGMLDMKEGEPFYGFTYSADYLDSANVAPLSISLPLQRNRFSGQQAQPFFEGLLPEGDVRASVARQLGISQNSPAKLLRAIGRDCAGDIAVLEESDPFQPPADDQYEPVEDSLSRLAAHPYEEIASLRAQNRLSLAGGQEKIALYHDCREPIEKGWYIPLEGSPSTHIIKPEIGNRYPQLALNEFLCMNMARLVGIPTPRVYYINEPSPLLVVERFDRVSTKRFTDGGLAIYRRLQQEDACQALGYTPAMKYELDGGAGVGELHNLLLSHSNMYLRDRMRFVRLLVFNFLIGNCDAHAKNYSFYLKGGTLEHAPAYDLLATTVYDGTFGAQLSRSMGMRIGRHANIDKVSRGDIGSLAQGVGMSDRLFEEEFGALAEALRETRGKVDALAASVSEQDGSGLVERIYEGVGRRIAQVQ